MKKLVLSLIVALTMVVGCTAQPASTPASVMPTSAPASTFVAPPPAYKVEVTKDIDYVTLLQPDAPVQKLDVYAPSEPGPWPVVVLMHSEFQSKDNAAYTSFAEELAGRGVVVFVPQRRSQSGTIEEAAKDNGRELREVHETWACAIRFVRERAADLGGDAEWVTVFGNEGSGVAAAFMGDDLQQLWDELASRRGGPPPQTDCLAGRVTAHVDAYVGYIGDYKIFEILGDSDPELWELTSPFALIGRNPSLLVHLVHGEKDNPTLFERVVEYHEALVNAGYDATRTVLGGGYWTIPWSGPDREALIQVILAVARR